MKKIIIAILSLLIVVSFAACSNSENNEQASSADVSSEVTSQLEDTTAKEEDSTSEAASSKDNENKTDASTKKAADKNNSESKTTYTSSTTKHIAVHKDAEKGKSIKLIVKKYIGKSEFKGELAQGAFDAKRIDSDSNMYKNEASEEYKKKAQENADKLVKEMKDYYGYGIELKECKIVTVGTGDNGVDSCYYQLTYTNKNDQVLEIRADSNGKIFYVNSQMTW